MGTEDYWQQEKKRNDLNKDNTHPVLAQTYEDMKANLPMQHPKVIYAECLKGALFLNQWAQSDSLELEDMAMLICRDTGCELTYCQATISDPYERPFKDCNQQYKAFTSCIREQQSLYSKNPEGRTMQQQVAYMIEKRRKEKYINVFPVKQDVKVEKEREYFVKETKLMDNENYKI